MVVEEVELRRIGTPPDWRAYHHIRRTVLYEARGRLDYMEDHPDDILPANHALVLAVQGEVAGVSRLDFREGHAILRTVAITISRQRQGLGRVMIERVEAYARAHGAPVLLVHSAPDATVFYAKLGFALAPPDEEPGNPRMTKGLTTA